MTNPLDDMPTLAEQYPNGTPYEQVEALRQRLKALEDAARPLVDRVNYLDAKQAGPYPRRDGARADVRLGDLRALRAALYQEPLT